MTHTAFLAAALGMLALPALAQDTAFELDLGASYDWRGGNDLNSSGRINDEIPEYALGQVTAGFATALDSGLLLQGHLRFDQSFAETTVETFFDSNDTYAYGLEAMLQLGQATETYYMGLYGGAGEVGFNPADNDQNTRFHTLGVQAALTGENWMFGGTLGLLNSQADDPEAIDNAVVLGLNGAYAFNNGATRVSATLGWIEGDQDTDSRSGPDVLSILSAGLEIEQKIATYSAHDVALYGGINWIEAREASSGGSTETANDTILTAGLRIRFGAGHQTGQQSGVRTNTPALPDMLRAIGAVPAVD